MPTDECIAKIAAIGRISNQRALELLQQVAGRAEEMRLTGKPDASVDAAAALAGDLLNAAKRQKTDALRNAAKRNAAMDEVEAAGGIRSAYDTLLAMLVGTSKGTRLGIATLWRDVAARQQAVVGNAIRANGLERTAINGSIDSDLGKEIIGLKEGATVSVTGNNPVRKLASAIVPALATMRARLNDYGANIADAMDYVAHTSHDPRKIRMAAGAGKNPDDAFAAWWGATEPRLADKTFENVIPNEGESDAAARTRFGRSVFDALVSGVHMSPWGALGLSADEKGFVPIAYEGSRNIARRLSQPRVLLWKDSDAWLGNLRDFGQDASISAAVMRGLDNSARQMALMQRLGTSATGNFNQLIRDIQEKYRNDLDGVSAFNNKIDRLKATMAHLDGTANIPASADWAGAFATVRAATSMADLGGLGITHAASTMWALPAEGVHHGIPRLQSLGEMVRALVQGRPSAEQQEILADIGAYNHGTMRDLATQWQPDAAIPGKVASMLNTYLKYTGINWLFDRWQGGMRSMLAQRLARAEGKSFEELDPHQSQMFAKYGIGPEEWSLLRDIPDKSTADGKSFLVPSDVQRVDRDRVAMMLIEQGRPIEHVDRYVNELADKLTSYYGDAAAHSVITAGIRERAMVLGTSRPGTLQGELYRSVAQFKMWPIAAMTQTLGREIHMSLSKGEATFNVGMIVATSALAGYLRMSVNALAGAQPLPSLTDMTRKKGHLLPTGVENLLSAAALGGGLGIAGDMLFGELNRGAQKAEALAKSAAGPVVGNAFDALKIVYDDWLNGKAGWSDMARWGVHQIPGNNLVYLKGAFDYLILFHIYSALDPTWWERTNRKMLHDQGQSMVGYTPGGAIPFAPWGLGSQRMTVH
jgi:hypothetical protein